MRKKLVLALLVVLLIVGGLGIGLIVRDPRIFPLKRVQIKATYQHLHPQTIQQAVTPYMAGSFFTVNIAAIQHQLLQLPWVYAVAIDRVWPDKIVIDITEQTAIARWNDSSMLNVKGQIFIPIDKKTLPDNLPTLFGPNDQIAQIWSYYQQMNKGLTDLDLRITGMGLNADGSWRLILNNGINVILGNVDIMKRFGMFVKAYPKIIGSRGNKVASVDLRYNSGLAIKWKV